MEVRLEVLPKKELIGKSLRMSLADNKTPQLWGSFMKDKSVIQNTIGTNLYSIQLYDELHYFRNFNPQTEFTKWAAIEVENINYIPIGFSSIIIEQGLYAIFIHKGLATQFAKTFQYILTEWLPQSKYELDNRPHFELLGAKYKNNHPDSEEEVWIPIKNRS